MNNLANDNSLMSNQLSGGMQQSGGDLLQQQGGMQQMADPSVMQLQGGMQEVGGSSSLMKQQPGDTAMGSMSNGLGSSLMSQQQDPSSNSLSQQQDPSSNSLSQQGSSMEQQQLGGQTMMQQGLTGSMEQQGQQQGSDSTMMQDPAGSTMMGTQDSQLRTSLSGETRKLEFIHVTKSGGSAVEKIAAENKIMWGACHYWKIPYLGCETPDWDFPKKRRVDRMPAGLHYQGEPWHAPPHWNDPNMMEDSDTFLIIRNPVSF
jgi:hypothetical protein